MKDIKGIVSINLLIIGMLILAMLSAHSCQVQPAYGYNVQFFKIQLSKK